MEKPANEVEWDQHHKEIFLFAAGNEGATDGHQNARDWGTLSHLMAMGVGIPNKWCAGAPYRCRVAEGRGGVAVNRRLNDPNH